VDVEVRGRRAFAHTGGVELDPSDGVVLLVHGAPADHSVWRYQTRHLAAAGYPVLAVDLPGHGKSEGPALTSVVDMADWLADLVEGLGAPWVTIVGHSMGSLIAAQTAAAHPHLVRSIVLVAPSDRMVVHPGLLDAARRQDRLAADLIVGWSHTGNSRFGHHPDPGVWTASRTRRLLERNAPVLAADLQACAEWDSSVANRIEAPALVIVGERDKMTPARAGKALAALVPHATVAELPGAAHSVHYTEPAALNAALMEWLAGSDG
jgi:pimeloyl-ACP methyl ester carboxylesterase